MRKVLVPLVVLAGVAVIAIAQRAYHVPRLPDRVAAHIGPSGEVDRWQAKEQAVAESARGWLVVLSILGGVALLSVLSVRFLPYQFVNLPNKDYWLHSSRRRGEAAAVVLAFFLWFLATAVAAGVLLTEDFMRASYSGRETGWTLPVVLGLLVAVAAEIAWLVVELSRPREARVRRRRADARAG